MKHDAFLVGTPRGKSKNKGFEIFITTAPIPDLSEKLIIFGRVIQGEHVVQVITLLSVVCCEVLLTFPLLIEFIDREISISNFRPN